MEGMPRRITSKGAEGRAAENEFARQALLSQLEELDEQINPLRERLRAGENVEAELAPLLDKRGEVARKIDQSETRH